MLQQGNVRTQQLLTAKPVMMASLAPPGTSVSQECVLEKKEPLKFVMTGKTTTAMSWLTAKTIAALAIPLVKRSRLASVTNGLRLAVNGQWKPLALIGGPLLLQEQKETPLEPHRLVTGTTLTWP
jgi:hypothetical protein